MKFLEKMWLMITLKVTKNLGFTHSLEDTFLKKKKKNERGGGGGGGGSPVQSDPPPPSVVLVLKVHCIA